MLLLRASLALERFDMSFPKYTHSYLHACRRAKHLSKGIIHGDTTVTVWERPLGKPTVFGLYVLSTSFLGRPQGCVKVCEYNLGERL